MQLYNTAQLKKLPWLILSFNGGTSGFSYHYRAVRVESLHPVLKARGYPLPPHLIEHRGNTAVFRYVVDQGKMYVFNVGLLAGGQLQKFNQLVGAGGPVSALVDLATLEHEADECAISSIGHWHLISDAPHDGGA